MSISSSSGAATPTSRAARAITGRSSPRSACARIITTRITRRTSTNRHRRVRDINDVVAVPRSFLNDGEHYDACHASRHDDLLFWIKMATAAKSVLELACGTGRIAIPLAVKGARVTGIDNCQSMIDQAKRNARGAGVEVDWITGDMRQFDLGRDDFDLVVLAFNGINLMLTLEDALSCLRCARKHLAP